MDGKIIQEPAQVQSGVTPTNYCTITAMPVSTEFQKGTANLTCPFYPKFVVLRISTNILFWGAEGLVIDSGGYSREYTYLNGVLSIPVYNQEVTTQYTLTAFG